MARNPLLLLGIVVAAVLVLAGGLAAAVGLVDATRQVAATLHDPHGGGDSEVRTVDDELTFPVQAGSLGTSTEGSEPDAVANDLWSLFATVAGGDAARIRTFSVYSDPDDTSLAAVWRDQKKTGFWHVEVNAAFADDRDELENTMVHEFGHILTLSDDQVPELTGACPTFELSEGCPEPDSLIARFTERFWAPYGDDVPADDGEDPDDVTPFFRANGGFDTFVSRYAATSAVEDAAESWAEYVLSETPGYTLRDATGDQVWSQKVRFFDEFPEFAAQRDRIREALGYS